LDVNVPGVDIALTEAFGRYSERWQPSDPLLVLVRTMLNQRTTHVHARKALENLLAQCPTWADVAALPYDLLVDLLRPAGLAKPKAGRVHAVLEQIHLDSGTYSLDYLQTMDSRSATRYLCGLPGVGPHTAALVLVFALGRAGVMPVETHVHRVARRLHWPAHDASPNAVQRAIETAAPDRSLMDLHVNLIRLGHRHCIAGNPDCPDCPISDLCPTARLQPWW
jgi:endonuclease III